MDKRCGITGDSNGWFGCLGGLAALVLKQQETVILEPPLVPRFCERCGYGSEA